MGTENPNRPTYSSQSPAANFGSQQNAAPFIPYGPPGGSQPAAIRSVPPALSHFQASPFSSEPLAGSEIPGSRPPPTSISSRQVRPPLSASSYATLPSGFQNVPPPSNNQVLPPHSLPSRPPIGPPPNTTPLAPGPPPTSHSLQSQIQPPQSLPIGSPLQNIKTGQHNPDVPFTAQQYNNIPYRPDTQPSQQEMGRQAYVTSSGTFQPAFPGHPNVQTNYASQLPGVEVGKGAYAQPQPPSSFLAQQRGYAPGPPISTPAGSIYPGHQVPQFAPPISTTQALAEDFSSLTIGSAPGSFDGGVDARTLPRPLDGDMEPKSLSEMYPLNCSSRFMQLTTGGIPNSQSLASRWHLPLGVVVCPLAEAPAEDEVPVVNFATTGIVRCRRCRTYINPYVLFTDNGRKWRCNICSLLNDVPSEYFAHIDASGRRVDLDQRPELVKGSVDFIAPAEYMVRPPMPPTYFFLIDVSISAVRSGMLEVMAQTVKSCLDRLPGFPRTQIGFITFDSTIHFYNMKSSLMQPQMMVISDLDDVFVPLPDDLLVNLSESRNVVESFLDTLPAMFADNLNVESAFGPALKAAFMVMSQLGGKLLIFQNTLPSLGVGRLRLRGHDETKPDKEQTLRLPEDPFYKQMAADLNKFQIAVNVYAFSDKYTDIASLGTLSKYTGGQVYYYHNFQASIHKERLQHELSRDLTRETAWESVIRIRCGKGVRFTSYHGNFMMRSTDLISLPAVDCDKAYVAQLALEDTLLTTQTVFVQVALLYTSSSGERRIRVHTAAAPVVTDLGEMYRLANTGAIISLFTRLAIEKTLSFKLEDARNSVQLRIVKALREYRNLYAVQHRLTGRMIYPDSLKFLPLYGLALCKSIPLRGFADVQLDERCAAGFTMMALPVKNLLKLLYPNLIRVDDGPAKAGGFENDPPKLPVTAQSLDARGVYIFDDGFRFIIWFGRSVSPDVAKNLLGEDSSADFSKITLCSEKGTPNVMKSIVSKLRGSSDQPSYFQVCHLVRQGEQPREAYFLLSNLVEDKFNDSNGYPDWMLQLYRQVQQNA